MRKAHFITSNADIDKIIEMSTKLSNRCEMLTQENSSSSYVGKIKIYFTDVFINVAESIKNIKKTLFVDNNSYIKHRTRLATIMNASSYQKIAISKHRSIMYPVLLGQTVGYAEVTENLKSLPSYIEEVNKLLEDTIVLLEKTANSDSDTRTKLRYPQDFEAVELKTNTAKAGKIIIDPKSRKEEEVLEKLIPNANVMYTVSENYLKLFDEISHSGLSKTVKLVDRLAEIAPIWKSQMDNEVDSRHSKYIVGVYKTSMMSIADCVTNIGVMLTIADQSSNFYIRMIDELSQRSK